MDLNFSSEIKIQMFDLSPSGNFKRNSFIKYLEKKHNIQHKTDKYLFDELLEKAEEFEQILQLKKFNKTENFYLIISQKTGQPGKFTIIVLNRINNSYIFEGKIAKNEFLEIAKINKLKNKTEEDNNYEISPLAKQELNKSCLEFTLSEQIPTRSNEKNNLKNDKFNNLNSKSPMEAELIKPKIKFKTYKPINQDISPYNPILEKVTINIDPQNEASKYKKSTSEFEYKEEIQKIDIISIITCNKSLDIHFIKTPTNTICNNKSDYERKSIDLFNSYKTNKLEFLSLLLKLANEIKNHLDSIKNRLKNIEFKIQKEEYQKASESIDFIMKTCFEIRDLDDLLNQEIIYHKTKRGLLFLITQILKMFLFIFVKRILPNFKNLSLALFDYNLKINNNFNSNIIDAFIRLKNIILMEIDGLHPFLSFFRENILNKFDGKVNLENKKGLRDIIAQLEQFFSYSIQDEIKVKVNLIKNILENSFQSADNHFKQQRSSLNDFKILFEEFVDLFNNKYQEGITHLNHLAAGNYNDLDDLIVINKFFEIYMNTNNSLYYEMNYYEAFKHENKVREYQIFQSMIIIDDIIYYDDKDCSQGVKTVLKSILFSNKFIKKLFENLEENDDILNYYTLIDSQITKDIFNQDCFVFNEIHSINDIKSHLNKCIFKKIALFRCQSNNEFSDTANTFFKFFNENYYKIYANPNKKKKQTDENTVDEFAFQFQHLIEDVLYIDYESIFLHKSRKLSLLSEEKISQDIKEKIISLNMIITFIHEIAHNKVFQFGIPNNINKSKFATPYVKDIYVNFLKSESGMLLEHLIAGDYFQLILKREFYITENFFERVLDIKNWKESMFRLIFTLSQSNKFYENYNGKICIDEQEEKTELESSLPLNEFLNITKEKTESYEVSDFSVLKRKTLLIPTNETNKLINLLQKNSMESQTSFDLSINIKENQEYMKNINKEYDEYFSRFSPMQRHNIEMYFENNENIRRLMQVYMWIGFDPMKHYTEEELERFRNRISHSLTYLVEFKQIRRHSFGNGSSRKLYTIKSFI